MGQDDERALVKGLAAMDDSAWLEFTKRYHRMLAVYVTSRFDCRADACEEIVEMTFVRCVKSISTFDPGRGSLAGWLRAVATNEAYTLMRGRERRHEQSLSALAPDIADVVSGAYDKSPLPDEIVAGKDFQAAVRETVAGLSPRHQEVLTMKYLEGMKAGEIAGRLDMTLDAVEALLARARAAFKHDFMTRFGSGGVDMPGKDR
jgi:RNA polymerase sigma-70 factor (ECF subfamily)